MSTSASTVLQALRAGDVIPNVVPESAAAGVKSALRVHYPEYTISEGEAIPRAATLKQPDLEYQNAVSCSGPSASLAGRSSARIRSPILHHTNDLVRRIRTRRTRSSWQTPI